MTTSQDAPELIQYSCERCKTRFVLPPSSRRLGIRGSFHAIFKGAGRTLKFHQGLRGGVGAARRELLAKKDDEAYQAFVLSFRFCHECRQFVCNDCWSKSRGTCLTCAGKATGSPVRARSIVAAAAPDIPRPIISVAPQRRGHTRRDAGLAGVTLAIVLLSIEGGVLLLNATGGPSDLSAGQTQGTSAPGSSASAPRQWVVTPGPGSTDNGTPGSTDIPIAITSDNPTGSLPPGVTAPPAPAPTPWHPRHPGETRPPATPVPTPTPTPAPGQLIITASSPPMTYGGSVPNITPQYAGLTGGDTAPATPPSSCSTTATSSSSVGSYPTTSCSHDAADPKYSIIYVTGSVTVTQAPLTITASGQSKTYGTTLNLGTSAFTASGLVNGDTVTDVTLTSAGSAAGAAAGTDDIVPSAAVFSVGSASDYSITYANGTLTVNRATLNITADDQSKAQGTLLDLGTSAFTPSGLVNGDTVTAVTLTSPGAAADAAVGIYDINASGAVFGVGSASNYTIHYPIGQLTVT